MRVRPKELLWRLSPPVAAAGPTWFPDTQGIRVWWPDRYEWKPAQIWVDDVRRGFEQRVELRSADLHQEYEGVVHFEVERDGQRTEVAIDYFDRHRLLDEVAARFPLVFKLQYLRDGYGLDHVVPGGYVPSRSVLYRYLRPLRRRRLRPPVHDVFGRFSVEYATEIRRATVQALTQQRRFGYEGDLKLLPYAVYLEDAASARVCLDLPGNGDMCHRLVEYLALGCCIVRPEPETRLHVDLVPDEHIVYYRPDLSDLVDVCAALIEDEARRKRLASAAGSYFDRYLHRDQLADYYLEQVVGRLR